MASFATRDDYLYTTLTEIKKRASLGRDPLMTSAGTRECFRQIDRLAAEALRTLSSSEDRKSAELRTTRKEGEKS